MARNLCSPATVRNLSSEVGISFNEDINLSDDSALLMGRGSGAGRRAGLIPIMSRRFEQQTGRRFDYQTNVDVTVDGTGYNSIFVPAKYLPIIRVNSLKVTGGINYAVSDLDVDADTGEIRFKTSAALVGYAPGYGLSPQMQSRQDRVRFPKGVANITINLDWGHVNSAGDAFEPPEDVQDGVAARVIMRLLGMEAATDERGAGIQSRSIEYWSESLGGKGRWADLREELMGYWQEAVENWRLGIDFD
jgi:hypothetical protein